MRSDVSGLRRGRTLAMRPTALANALRGPQQPDERSLEHAVAVARSTRQLLEPNAALGSSVFAAGMRVALTTAASPSNALVARGLPTIAPGDNAGRRSGDRGAPQGQALRSVGLDRSRLLMPDEYTELRAPDLRVKISVCAAEIGVFALQSNPRRAGKSCAGLHAFPRVYRGCGVAPPLQRFRKGGGADWTADQPLSHRMRSRDGMIAPGAVLVAHYGCRPLTAPAGGLGGVVPASSPSYSPATIAGDAKFSIRAQAFSQQDPRVQVRGSGIHPAKIISIRAALVRGDPLLDGYLRQFSPACPAQLQQPAVR